MRRALVVLGPTAAGKSRLALRLALELKAEIISLDSVQVYRGLDIGSAKPTLAERASVRHHLIDIVDPDESYNAAQFLEDCRRLVFDIGSRGAVPLICGGTMMYYKALSRGISPVPSSTPEAREAVALMAREEGWPALHERLKDIDPKSYERLKPNDRQRLARAHEVYLMSRRPISEFYDLPVKPRGFALCELILLPPEDRARLREQIRRRFVTMLKEGLIEEVRAIWARYGEAAAGALRSVGYRQVLEYLRGEYGYDELIERGVIATARLAKHQMTWLRGGLGEPAPGDVRHVLDAHDEENETRALDLARRWLAGDA